MLKIGFIVVLTLVSQFAIAYIDNHGVLRTNSGEVIMVPTGFHAQEICPANMRIPSAREWAQFAQEHGAKGILELNQVSGQIPEGYEQHRVLNANDQGVYSTRDRFYFNKSGYKPPSNVIGQYQFWTSSSAQSLPGMKTFFSGFHGDMAYHNSAPWDGYPMSHYGPSPYDTRNRIFGRAVRCIPR